jgi:hypothetical protein
MRYGLGVCDTPLHHASTNLPTTSFNPSAWEKMSSIWCFEPPAHQD